LAGEGRETQQNDDGSSWFTLRDDCTKVFKLKGGQLFGGSHSSEDIERLYQSLIKNQPPPKLEDIAGLLINQRGHIMLYEGNIWQRIKMPYYAIGSGSIIAFGALDAGASALEAVRIACRRDPWSGGKISSVRLHK
jgi:hypothetical protein